MEIRKLNNWLLHKSKIPLNARTGQAASSSDPATWSSYDEAVQAVSRFKADGVGFAFSEPFYGIDLDDCVVNGKLNDFAKGIVAKCRSYTEFSPSKTGIHIILKGKLPRAIKTPTFEAYQTGRYFTVTQQPYGVALPIRSVNEEFIESLFPEGDWKRRRPLTDVLENIGEGSRNNDLTVLAGSLRRRGYSVEEMYAILKATAKEVNFPLEELALLCQSVGRYEPDTSLSDHADSVEQFLAEMKPVQWISPGLIAKSSLGFVAGLQETKKTFMLMDLAIEAARGGQWLGKFPVKQSKVLFIDQERFKAETQRRFRSLMEAKGIKPSELKETLFVKCGTTTRLNLEDSFNAFKHQLDELRPDLVLIDSFATFSTVEENSRTEVQKVLERIKELRNTFGCTFIFIDHENKGVFHDQQENEQPNALRMVGSVAKPAAAEFIFTVRKQDQGSVIVYNTKNTMAPNAAPFICDVIDVAKGIRVEAH